MQFLCHHCLLLLDLLLLFVPSFTVSQQVAMLLNTIFNKLIVMTLVHVKTIAEYEIIFSCNVSFNYNLLQSFDCILGVLSNVPITTGKFILVFYDFLLDLNIYLFFSISLVLTEFPVKADSPRVYTLFFTIFFFFF